MHYQETFQPTNPKIGDWWVDTSTNPKKLYRHNGIRWVEFNPNMKIINDTLPADDPYKAYDRARGVL